MKCFRHKTDAVAICAYCGRGVCDECISSPTAARIVCSNECANALAQSDKAMQSLLHKSVQSLKASAFYCYLCGGLSAAGAVAAWFVLPLPFLVFFTGGCAVVLVASGAWYTIAARRQS